MGLVAEVMAQVVMPAVEVKSQEEFIICRSTPISMEDGDQYRSQQQVYTSE